MSRSYKKHLYCGDRKGKEKKRIANQKVRAWLKQHPDVLLHHGDYKKLYEQWDICDYYTLGYTWEQHWEHVLKLAEYRNKYFKNCINFKPIIPNEKEEYKKWYLINKGK